MNDSPPLRDPALERRRPRGSDYLPQLDGIRAIAVGLVLLAHCVVVPSRGTLAWGLRHTLSNGWIGVDLFIVLSGFLITGILLRERTELHYFRNFYVRRLLRIFPLYYLLLVILWIAAPRLPFGPMYPAWTYFTYTSNLTAAFARVEWSPLGHTWSVAIEEQYYLLYPWVVFSVDRVR